MAASGQAAWMSALCDALAVYGADSLVCEFCARTELELPGFLAFVTIWTMLASIGFASRHSQELAGNNYISMVEPEIAQTASSCYTLNFHFQIGGGCR